MPVPFDFTADNKKYIKENWGKISISEMSRKIGCGRTSLTNEAKKLGIYTKSDDNWTEEEEKFLKKHIGKWSAKKIALKLGKTVSAVYNKTNRLNISVKTDWTAEEDEQLRDLWGIYKIETISKKMGRTVEAIKHRVKRLELDSSFEANGEFLKVSEIEKLLNVSGDRIRRTWFKKGLKFYKVALSNKKSIYGIQLDDLMIFLKQHQDEFDSRFLEMYALGSEPQWLIDKRKKDFQNPPQEYRLWSDNEIKILRYLLSKGENYRVIGDKINRSQGAVKDKVEALGLSFNTNWGNDEIAILRDNYEQGCPKNYKELSEELGRGYYGIAKEARKLGYNKNNLNNNY